MRPQIESPPPYMGGAGPGRDLQREGYRALAVMAVTVARAASEAASYIKSRYRVLWLNRPQRQTSLPAQSTRTGSAEGAGRRIGNMLPTPGASTILPHICAAVFIVSPPFM